MSDRLQTEVPLPVITNVYRCALNWTNSTNAMVATNVIHVQKAAVTASDVATELDTDATNTMWELQTTDQQVTQIVVTKLDGSSASFPYTPATPANWTGHGGAGDFVPQVAAIVKCITGKRGRSYRGRIFLPWIAEAQMGDGGLNGTSRATCTAAWREFLADMQGNGFVPVVASYKLATAEPILDMAVEGFVATQRRRLVRTSAI